MKSIAIAQRDGNRLLMLTTRGTLHEVTPAQLAEALESTFEKVWSPDPQDLERVLPTFLVGIMLDARVLQRAFPELVIPTPNNPPQLLASNMTPFLANELPTGVNAALQADRVWRMATRRGISIDGDAAEQLKRDARKATRRAIATIGVDPGTTTEGTREWVRSKGIVTIDPEASANAERLVPAVGTHDGLPKIGKDYREAAVVPTEAADGWREFCATRTIAMSSRSAERIAGAADLETGRLHAPFTVIGAGTGRTVSAGSEAVQNLQSLARTIFRSDDDTRRLFSVDYSAMEPRITAWLSGDPAMREDVRDDPYTAIAERIGETTGAQVTRNTAKGLWNAASYGSGPALAAAWTGLSLDEGRELIQGFGRAYPTFDGWRRRVVADGRAGHPLWTGLGRRLLHVNPAKAHTQAVAHVVQGTGADLMNRASFRAFDAAIGTGGTLLVPLHDELVGEAPADRVEEAADAVSAAMTLAAAEWVHLPTKTEIFGTHWG